MALIRISHRSGHDVAQAVQPAVVSPLVTAPFMEGIQKVLEGLFRRPEVAMQYSDVCDRPSTLLGHQLFDSRVAGRRTSGLRLVGRGIKAIHLAGASSGGYFHVIDGRLRFRDRLANFAHRLEVSRERFLKVSLGLYLRVASRRTPRHVWRISGIPCIGPFYDDGVTPCVHFKPAFVSIAFSVPAASSFPGFPGTVMTNRCAGCITSRTFIGMTRSC